MNEKDFYRQIETIKTEWHDAFGMMQISEFYRRVRGERRGIPNLDWRILKLCALGDLRGDKSQGFYDSTIPQNKKCDFQCKTCT